MIKELFIVSLFLTFIISRVSAHWLHDRENYRKNEKSKTITGWLRRITGQDWHHIHFGLIILLILIPLVSLNGLTKSLTIFLAVGLSLVIDQIAPLLGFGNYFSRKMLIVSILIHLITALIGIFMLS